MIAASTRARRAPPVAWLWALALASACGGKGERAPDVAVIAPTALPATSASVARPPASATALRDDRADVPPMPAGVDPEKFEIVSQVCAAGTFTRDDGETVLGCIGAPPFDAPKKRPNGRVEAPRDLNDLCVLEKIHRGHFTKPDAEQAVLSLSVCTDDGGNFNGAWPGSAALVERVDGRWRYVASSSVTLDTCQTVKTAAGLTRFLCREGFGAFGDGELRWLELVDFAKTGKDRVAVLAKMFATDFAVPCQKDFFPPIFLAEYGVVTLDLAEPKVADADGDGDDDVTVEVKRASVPPSKALEKKVWALCGMSNDGYVQPQAYMPKPKTFTLSFRGEGDTFVPTKETAALLEKWREDTPDFWWSIR